MMAQTMFSLIVKETNTCTIKKLYVNDQGSLLGIFEHIQVW